ncbi:MAG: hypothetical protein P8L72_00210 [Flavobacteriaceae bacterium]|nr:hypothetical protein [Flavobacteriaceae bacterium]
MAPPIKHRPAFIRTNDNVPIQNHALLLNLDKRASPKTHIPAPTHNRPITE